MFKKSWIILGHFGVAIPVHVGIFVWNSYSVNYIIYFSLYFCLLCQFIKLNTTVFFWSHSL